MGFCLKRARVARVALVGELCATICAFCLITSAGVRMAQETSSASDEAAAWMRGVGTTPDGELAVRLREWRSDLVRS